MDWTAVSTMGTSLGVAMDIARSLMGLRDQALVGEKIAALNDVLLKAQEQLLAHNAALLQLQNENFEAREEIRELKEAARERGRYTLVEVASGQFAYRVNVAPQQSGPTEPSCAEPEHHLCQRCFDGGSKVVLQRLMVADGVSALCCSACEQRIGFVREHAPSPRLVARANLGQRERDW